MVSSMASSRTRNTTMVSSMASSRTVDRNTTMVSSMASSRSVHRNTTMVLCHAVDVAYLGLGGKQYGGYT